MKRIEVESSNIKSIWYDNINFTLEIEFNDNSVYQYLNVPKYEYDWIISADSHWKYLNSNIKWIYDFIQII